MSVIISCETNWGTFMTEDEKLKCKDVDSSDRTVAL